MQLLTLIVLAALGALVLPNPACPAAGEDEVVRWLDKLEARGRDIRTLEARVVHTKVDRILSDSQTRLGEVFYAAAGEGGDPPTRFAVLFDRFIVDEKLRKQPLEFIFDGEWLVEKDHAQRRFEKRQVVGPGEGGRIDPLSIDGPFPLPLGQKRDRVLERFEVVIVPADAEADPEGVETLHLHLTPRPDAPQVREQKKFDRVDFWFDKATLLPVKVRSVEGSVETTVVLSEIRVNEADEARIARVIDVRSPGEGWRVEIKKWQE